MTTETHLIAGATDIPQQRTKSKITSDGSDHLICTPDYEEEIAKGILTGGALFGIIAGAVVARKILRHRQ